MASQVLSALLLGNAGSLFQVGKHTMVLLGLVGTYTVLWFFSGILEKLGILLMMRGLLLVVSVFLACSVGWMLLYDKCCRAKQRSVW